MLILLRVRVVEREKTSEDIRRDGKTREEKKKQIRREEKTRQDKTEQDKLKRQV